MQLWQAIKAHQPKSQPPVIYQWECVAPNKDPDGARFYIGQAKTDRAFARAIQHIFSNDHLGLSIRKYGLHNFRYTVLTTCATDADLDEAEKNFIAQALADGKKLYNISGGGQGSERVAHIGETHRRKLTPRQKAANKYRRKIGEDPPPKWTEQMITQGLLEATTTKNKKGEK